MEDIQQLRVGDTVRIKSYSVTTLQSWVIPSSRSGRDAVVLELYRDYAWRPAPNRARLRVMLDAEGDAYTASEPLSNVVLLAKGPGYFELGNTHPFSERELRDQRGADFVARVESLNLEHEGFSNAATFLAWVYLNQQPSARRQLSPLVIKDGTLNPSRVEKLFNSMHLAIDPWALECPMDLPSEFSHYLNPIANKQRPNWNEVAQQFKLANQEMRLTA
jgi:hypothetical protein